MEVNENTASEQVKSVERLLREVFARALARTHGPDWEEELSQRVKGALQSVRHNERRSRPEAPPEHNLLGYAGYDQIKAVARHHWNCCIQAVGLWPTEEWATGELNRLHAIRNPAQHARTLFPHEYIEAEGIARRLRFQIERQRREEASVADQYWLYIEEAEDSLGHRTRNEEARSNVQVHGSTLTVGDLLTLKVRVFDPWGRKLQYRLSPLRSRTATDWQESPEFQWTAGPVGRSIRVDIDVRADGEPHADSSVDYDTFASFTYEVRHTVPPRRMETDGPLQVPPTI